MAQHRDQLRLLGTLARLTAGCYRSADSRLLMLPGVGHVAQIEAPREVAAAVAGLWAAAADGSWEDPTSNGR